MYVVASLEQLIPRCSRRTVEFVFLVTDRGSTDATVEFLAVSLVGEEALVRAAGATSGWPIADLLGHVRFAGFGRSFA